jgi:hypothetical protein
MSIFKERYTITIHVFKISEFRVEKELAWKARKFEKHILKRFKNFWGEIKKKSKSASGPFSRVGQGQSPANFFRWPNENHVNHR